MSEWIAALAKAIEREGRATLVTVALTSGSVPREAGTAMVVGKERVDGTIGGGHLEYEAIEVARKALLQDGGAPATWIVRFPLAARLGQCCGGVATLAFSICDAGSRPWIADAGEHAARGTPFAVVAPLAAGREATRLIVGAEDARGTLGDAELELAAIAIARARLAGPAREAKAATGIVVQQGVTLLVHVVRPDPFAVLVFGNGHVGRALVHVLGALPARVRWLDSREQDFPVSVPDNVECVATDAPETEIAAAPAGSFVVVMTHSHSLDFALIEAALARDDWRYLGLIGSRSKRAQLERRLTARGFPVETLGQVTCPIGAGTIRSKEPGAIAIAVALEMLARREATAEALQDQTALS